MATSRLKVNLLGHVKESGQRQGKDQSEGWGKEILQWDQKQSGACKGGAMVRGGAVAEGGGECGLLWFCFYCGEEFGDPPTEEWFAMSNLYAVVPGPKCSKHVVGLMNWTTARDQGPCITCCRVLGATFDFSMGLCQGGIYTMGLCQGRPWDCIQYFFCICEKWINEMAQALVSELCCDTVAFSRPSWVGVLGQQRRMDIRWWASWEPVIGHLRHSVPKTPSFGQNRFLFLMYFVANWESYLKI